MFPSLLEEAHAVAPRHARADRREVERDRPDVIREGRGEEDPVRRVVGVAARAVAAVRDHPEAPVRADAARRDETDRGQHLRPGALDDERAARAALSARVGDGPDGERAHADVVEHVDAEVDAHRRLRNVEREVGPEPHVPVREELRERVRLRHGEERVAARRVAAIEVEVPEELGAAPEEDPVVDDVRLPGRRHAPHDGLRLRGRRRRDGGEHRQRRDERRKKEALAEAPRREGIRK
ncbi:MAG: hypothetical protein R3B82_25200 [Sandaracinaceae bacterium]